MWPSGERFPWSNTHELNLDWVIKVVKYFIDNYDTINETIESANSELTIKKDELIAMLNSWYNTHSSDIADELANAILTINSTVSAVIQTIPADYTDFYNEFKKNIELHYLCNDIAFPPYDTALPKTQNGITFSKVNGGINAAGTASGTATFIIREGFSLPANVKKIHLEGCPSGGSDNTYRLGFAKTTGVGTYENLIADIGNGADYNIVNPSDNYTLVIRIGAGTTINSVFSPVLTDANEWDNKKLTDNAGYNINTITLPYHDGTFSNRSGVDALSSWDGSVFLSSQGINETNINFYVKTDIKFPKNVQKVKISGCPENPTTPKYCMRLGMYNPTGSGTSGWSTVATDYGNGAEVEILPDASYILVITALPLKEFNNIKFTPSITDAFNVSIKETQEMVFGSASMEFLKTSGDYQGDCCIIKTGKCNGLIDMGYNEDVNTLKAALTNDRITKIDFIIITHYHSDHIGGTFANAIDNLINSGFDLSECVFYLPHKDIDWSLWIGEGDNKQETETDVINKLNALGATYIFPDNNQSIIMTEYMTIRFFNTQNFPNEYYEYTDDMNSLPTDHTNYNSFSMLCEIELYGKKILMAADATPITEQYNYQYIKGCDLYKIEHHGINHDTYDAWLNCINPQYAVISNYSRNYQNYFTYTRKTVRSIASKTSIYSTLDGKVTAIINAKGISMYGGQATQIGYDNMPSLTIQAMTAMYINNNAAEQDKHQITTNQAGYMNITGTYVEKGNVIYFVMILDMIANINSGLADITRDLPAPANENEVFIDLNGANYFDSISYDTNMQSWRINNRHNAGTYSVIAGAYRKATE